MRSPRELAVPELDQQAGLVVPHREVMSLVNLTFGGINVAPITGVNLSLALNAATVNSAATAISGQVLGAFQG